MSNDFGKRVMDELETILGDQFKSLNPAHHAAALRASAQLGRAAIGLPVDSQILLEAKATLSNVKVIGLAKAGNLWDAIGNAIENLLGPLVKIGAGLFGIKF